MALSPFGPQPKVTLVSASGQPLNLAIAAARTCYTGRVITQEEVGATEESRALRDRIASSTYEAGHHTVWQHAHFTFALEQVSRQVIWALLHAHPFYNSEQVSQRYVEVKPGRYVVPSFPDEALRNRYVDTVNRMHALYAELTQALMEPASDVFFSVFPARRKKAELYAKDIKKKAQEVARYALPVATHAHLYHSISLLTLFRYWRLCEQWDVPHEARALVQAMVDAVRAHDPDAFRLAQDPVPLEDTLEARALLALGADAARAGHGGAFCQAFDGKMNGHISVLEGHVSNAPALVADAVRDMLGVLPHHLPDERALAQVLDPALNANLGDTLRLHTMAKLTRALHHATYTFRKKLSHTADSQDQRHRMTPGSRPVLAHHVDLGNVDVVIPALMERAPRARGLFEAGMKDVWATMEHLASHGAAPQSWSYLLPNAFPVRFMESGDLSHLHHKWTTRLCFTAQEEIWRACVEEVAAVRAVHPTLASWLLPPCGLRHRAGTTPYCPEGPRYCGVPVWKQDLRNYLRVL